MLRLHAFPLNEPREIDALRRESTAAAGDVSVQIALGIALSGAGCTYEAAALLRPLRSRSKSTDAADQALLALEAQTWWNKNWREFVHLKRGGNSDAALELLADRAVLFWDMPPLLIHLGDIAVKDGRFELANHLYQRVFNLAQRGLPKMNMAAFEYVSQAAMVETLLLSGKADEALERHRAITPNPGNAMAHEIQYTTLLVATFNLDAAMRQAASTLITAEKHRSGYSREIRTRFIEAAPELAPLRERADWGAMVKDPLGYLRGA